MKRGPKPGSKWRWYYIKRVRDGKYFEAAIQRASPGSVTYRFTSDKDRARTFRLKAGMSMLCRIRRRFRLREHNHMLALGQKYAYRRRTRRARPLPPDLLVLEVQGDPEATINYPWRLPD